MIKLEIKSTHKTSPKTIFIDEKTMIANQYDKDITAKEIDHVIALLQKTIDSVYDMPFTLCHYYNGLWIEGMNDDIDVTIANNHDWVRIHPYGKTYSIFWCDISYDDFKKILMAQHKENEVAYLLLKGVFI